MILASVPGHFSSHTFYLYKMHHLFCYQQLVASHEVDEPEVSQSALSLKGEGIEEI